MKKVLAVALALVMILAMSTAIFAGFTQEDAFMEVAFSIKKATVVFNPDGVINDGEYYKLDLDDSWISAAWNDDNNEEYAETLRPDTYISWDDDYVYCATSWAPPVVDCEYDGDEGNIWQSCAIQISAAEIDSTGTYRLEYGIAKSTDTGDLLKTVWADEFASGFSPEAGVDFTVTITDGVTLYECRTPWTAFVDACPGEGGQFLFNIVWSSGEYADYIHTQLASGCTGNGKNADYFATVTLEGAGAAAAPSYTYPSSGESGSIITGSLIGNETGWGDNADAGRAAAFDGNSASFFDPLGVGDGYCGVDAGESYILDKVAILPRDGQLPRYVGAMIQGSNDGENWTTLFTASTEPTAQEWQITTAFDNNTGYRYFRYYNETNHGDVAEVEFYGTAGSAAADTVVETPTAVETPVTTAPATFDIITVAAITLVASLGTAVVAKKK